MEEVWKNIKGYEGLYQVSNLGRVRTLPHKTRYVHKDRAYKGLILKPILKDIGYYVVSLHKNGKQKQEFVHRLVAEAFCNKKNDENIVDHINTDTKDNRASNLRWTTIRGNVNNPISVKHRTEALRKMFCGKIGILHPKSKAVIQSTMDGKFIKKWDSASDVVRQCGFDSGSISHCCKGEQKSHKGYRWKYAL